MELRVLGPIALVDEGRSVRLPGEKQRRLLAALAVKAGATAAVDVLIDAVWPDSAPPSAAKLVQVYVSQLRKLFADRLAIETRSGGYALASNSPIDATRFVRLFEEGSAARRAGNLELAVALLDRALALWRGAAYGEFTYDDFARTEAERLEEMRLAAAEERFEAGLAQGHEREVLPQLLAFAAEHPLREAPQAQAMVALYRCGRQAEALDLYAATRKHLRDELGLDPGRDLGELQRRILEHDPGLKVVRAAEPAIQELPVPPNPLIGRERELAQLRELLTRDDVRLLVLTGAGGTGKTRLALEAARELTSSFANGAAFVLLGPVHDPALLVEVILRTFAVDDVDHEDPFETLVTVLRGRELLLVLDNAEHLHDAMPVLVDMLARLERVTLLVTSRAVLHLSGEHVFPVQPLNEDAARNLFYARARQADTRFNADRSEDESIRRICARVDGLPLAIELAAARTTSLRPHALLERLEARLPILTDGPRDLPARQQTLRATLDWSFDLLSAQERKRAARLAVFVGRFDREAAEEICEVRVEELTALVERSLLQPASNGGFAYLETVREYVLELLNALPDAAEIRRRHFRHFLRLAEAADISAVRRRGTERLDIADAARDNLRAALAWSIETSSIALGLELASAMERYWVTHDPREGMRWFGALLGHPEAAKIDPAVRADALRAYGSATDIAGDDNAARRLYEESLTLFEQLGDERGRAVLLHRLGISAMRRGDLAAARELIKTSHAIHEQTDNQWGQAQTIGTLGAIARDSGDPRRAAELMETSAAMAREVGVRWWEGGMLAELASLSLQMSEIEEAEARARASLTLAEDLGDRAGQVFGVGLLAAIAAARGEYERAEQLWSAVAEEDGVAPLGGWRRHRQELKGQVEYGLGHPLASSGGGSNASLDDAVALALRPGSRRTARTSAGRALLGT